jgi:hypothetical protein
MPLSPATNSEVYARPVAGSTAEQFLDQAEDCRRLSSKARKAVDKAFWLRLSDYWLELREEAKTGDTRSSTCEKGAKPLASMDSLAPGQGADELCRARPCR